MTKTKTTKKPQRGKVPRIYRTEDAKVFTRDGNMVALAITELWAEKIVKALVRLAIEDNEEELDEVHH
jgi:hypothetical protein